MHIIAPEVLKGVESATDHFIKALTYDLEIVNDHHKHSLWLSAIAAAGVAFVLSKLQLTSSPALRLSVIAFAASVLVGGWITHLFQREFRDKRVAMTLLGKQRAILACGEQVVENSGELYMQVFNGSFLNEEDRKQLLRRGRIDATRHWSRLLFLQNSFVAGGYLAMVSNMF